MTRVTANGYFDAEDSEQVRFEKRKALNTQRTEDYKNGAYALAGGVVDPLSEDAPQFEGLLRLLQNAARLPSPQSELQQRLERGIFAFLPEYANPAIQQRDSLRRAAGASPISISMQIGCRSISCGQTACP